RGALGGEVEHIGREPFGGGFERQAGAGGVLEEEVDHGASAQHGQLLDFAFGHEGHLLGDVEDADGLGPGQRAGVEQMLHSRPPEMVTASSPSISARLTLTRSLLDVGRFLPTWSARIGRSRWPRSTRTASRTLAGRPTSERASSPARMVRPEKSTSSTRTTVFASMPAAGIRVGSGAR